MPENFVPWHAQVEKNLHRAYLSYSFELEAET